LNGTHGFASLKWSDIEGDNNLLAIDLLGKSLQKIFELCQHRFSLKTVLAIADQAIQRIQFLHEKGYIHRDLKPENFVLGLGKNKKILNLIDFGLARKYRNLSMKHIPFRDGIGFEGTAKYASISTHLRIEHSRRDDMESLGYAFIYLLRGDLPWQNILAENPKLQHQKINEVKISTSLEKLCKGLPQEFSTFLETVRKLTFTDEPDYAGYRKMFRDLFMNQGFFNDCQFECDLFISESLPKLTDVYRPSDDNIKRAPPTFFQVNGNPS
jgi:casein kinase 1